ncbi:putrescine:ornithine antiporter, APA family [Clostridium cavendishii DSM 21758]|uniref:Putrescine transporter n=1 Tax=Clostridium cavendishii DSM 21758 TaxID=1121302 RepID=A0A1M6HQ81_9CLOT|nr:putrescine-ornithine antiporter [Clostridium cavendishii]SHJ24348.1 putrescine:ornithine antiporter, APA family [Clostridium cavendishii DSM 21758]
MGKQKNKMSVVQLTMITAINMMGSGIIMLPTKLAEVGTMSILSWVVTGIGSMALAYAFAQCGMFSRKSGGMGGYAEYAHGKSGSFMANYSYGLSLVIANIAIAISAVGYASVLFDIKLSPLTVGICTIFTLWLATVLNFGGASITGKLGSFTVWGVIIPVLVMSTVGWFWFSGSQYAAAWNPHNFSFFDGIGKSISITLWAFLGLESASANMDAVDNPKRNVPIACLGGTIGAALIYIISTNVIAGIVPNADLLNTNAPFGLAFASMFSPVVGKIVMGMMVLSCFGSLLGWQFTIAGVFRTSAVEGYFPKIFGKVTKTGTPIMGMVIITIAQSLLALMTISPTLAKQFDVLVNLAVVTNVIPYLLSMAAVHVIMKSEGVPDKKVKVTTFISVIASIYSLYALYSSGLEPMFYGAIVTFAGWTLYGFVSHRFDLKKNENVKNVSA